MSFDEEMLVKVDKGVKLDEYELRELVCNSLENKVIGTRRWQQDVISIVQLGNRYFAIRWLQGLTECQENDYLEQPTEVRRETHTRIIEETVWVDINQ